MPPIIEVKTPDEGCKGPTGEIVNVLGLVALTITEPPVFVGQILVKGIGALKLAGLLTTTDIVEIAVQP